MPKLVPSRRRRCDNYNINIGVRIRLMREELEISQGELAEEADMAQSQLSRIENGERSLSLQQATAIAEVLDLPLSELAEL